MDVYRDLKAAEQSSIVRKFLKKQRWYRGRLESEKDRPNIKDIKQQQYISGLQTHVDIMSLAMQDLELIERYVIEQVYYEGIRRNIISEKLGMEIKDINKISSKSLKKIRLNLCGMDIGITNKDKLKKGMF
ncbi:MAG: hypothetical protein RR657_07070 [Peptostreptococcaceae bacterium]